MNRGHNREVVFADDDDRRYFLTLLARYQERFPWRLYHYCLMSNHFHLLVQLADPKKLSSLLAGLLRSYVHYYNRRYGFCGHLWQGRFKSPAIEVDRYLLSCGRYIERNPVEACLAEYAWDYPWSSCRHYALGLGDALLAANPWYDQFGSDAAARLQRWREFLQDDDPAEAAIRRGDWIVSEAALRSATCQQRGRPMPRGRGRPTSPSAADG
jgi:putative transposase